MLADTLTPVNIYLKVRDKFPNSILLESNDYKGNDNSYSFICLKPIAEFKLMNEVLSTEFPNGKKQIKAIGSKNVLNEFKKFVGSFSVDKSMKVSSNIDNGLFGYIAYDSVRYFDDFKIKFKTEEEKQIPDILYHLYQIVIVINHYKNELYIVEYNYNKNVSLIPEIEEILNNKNYASFKFNLTGKEKSNYTDATFIETVKKIKSHCKRGDVFQLVLSREYTQSFAGDDFNVYRALRSINPSPYLFYFDYGNFKLFGSSPEAQLTIKNKIASIYPIAGTYKRTGTDEIDNKLAAKLLNDKKENAEHTMLVDLARNDLSKHCNVVSVDNYKEIQFYSHVIHLVSKVSGKIDSKKSFQIIGDTFPAGTLSGAPKYRAIQLINQYEKSNRGFYGGCIGFIGFNGDFNHAIMIRTFFSKNNKLYYRAGAGIVESSDELSETDEVKNKLAALKKALTIAKTI